MILYIGLNMAKEKKKQMVNINFVVEESFKQEMLEQAEKEYRNLSNFIGYAVRRYLDEVKEKVKRKKR